MVEDDEWLAVENADTCANDTPQEIPDIDAEKPVDVTELGDDDDIPDMDDFDEENNLVEEDPVRLVHCPSLNSPGSCQEQHYP